MHGLRKINNTYTPDGSGRDLLIYYDPAFRGGRQCDDKFSPHFPKPETGDVKLGRAPKTGYDARIEAGSQHLNLSRSSFNTNRAKKINIADPYANRLEELRLLSTTRASETLFRSKSDPALLGSCPFRRSYGAVSAATQSILPRPLGGSTSMTQLPKAGSGVSSSPTKSSKKEIWTEPGERHQYMGFSRTAYGGLWKAMSQTGPG